MSGALAALPEPMLLTGLLESNDNAVVVYGTQGGSWNDNPATRIRAAFDGDTSTYTDMVTTEAWGGVGFVKPVRVTSVRVCLRVGGYSARLAGGLLQGANTSDFSDAVTVHVFKKYPEQGVWTSEDVSQARGLTTSFRYYRIYTDKVLGCGYGFGGLAEVEFVGYDPATLVGVEPAKPTVSKWWLMNGSLSFYSTADANTACLEIQRRWRGEGDDGWTYFATVKPTKTDGTSVRYDQVGKTLRSADFRVRAVNATAVSAWSDVVSLDQPPYLTGTYCGTTTCYSDYRGDKAFDGIPENVTEVTPTATAFAALDFGEVRTLTGLRYMTRCDQRADRSANIVFEVASQPDFSDAVAVHTTSGKGSDFKLRTICRLRRGRVARPCLKTSRRMSWDGRTIIPSPTAIRGMRRRFTVLSRLRRSHTSPEAGSNVRQWRRPP